MKYFGTAMRNSKHRKPPSLSLYSSSREASPRCSSVLSDWDADDEGFMSSGEFLPARPLSVSIPTGPYCPRRPTLQEVLSNTAPPPWNLSAFMAYLSQNHCLETLEFTMDASRYTKYYRNMVDCDPHTPLSPKTEGCEYVKMLWQKLLNAYIAPNGPREVNLPSDVRDRLMSLPVTYTPPHPSSLDGAVKIIYELMDESVLVPFLNSVAFTPGAEMYSSPWTSNDSVMDGYNMTGSLDERSLSPTRSRVRRDNSPPSGSGQDAISQSSSVVSPRISHQSHLSAGLSRAASRLSANLSGSSAASSSLDAPDSLTDDSLDAASPSSSGMEPMTPPTTPPTSDTGFASVNAGTVSPSTSPVNSRGDGSSSWKKMGAKLGWKKSRSGRGSGSSTSSSQFPVQENKEEGDSIR